jgi:hypothetical protein
MHVNATGMTDDDRPEVMSLPEIINAHKGRWVAIEVTERDKNSQPVEGRVVEVEADRHMLAEKTAKYDDVCIFYAGDPIFRLLL